MSDAPLAALVQSIQARLKNEAAETGRPFVELLELFAIERFLHRLGRSEHREHFVLKGGLLLRHWLGAATRPTRDIDLLGAAGMDEERLRALLREVLEVDVEQDGIAFALDSIVVRRIRVESPVLGLRAKFDAQLGRTKLRYQVDVGLGDAVFPPTEEIIPGGLLGFPMASVRAYTAYTTIAEKLEATAIPEGTLDGLRVAFAESSANGRHWRAFLEKSGLTAAKCDLPETVAEIRRFADPVLDAAREQRSLDKHWPPGGPWR